MLRLPAAELLQKVYRRLEIGIRQPPAPLLRQHLRQAGPQSTEHGEGEDDKVGQQGLPRDGIEASVTAQRILEVNTVTGPVETNRMP